MIFTSASEDTIAGHEPGKPDKYPTSLFLEVERALNDKPEGGEATLYGRRQILMDLKDKLLDPALSENTCAIKLLAFLSTRLQQWRNAIKYWFSLAEKDSTWKEYAWVEAAKAFSQIGRYDRALELLSKVWDSKNRPQNLESVTRQVHYKADLQLSAQIGNKIYQIAFSDLPKTRHLLKAAVSIAGHSDPIVNSVDYIMDALGTAKTPENQKPVISDLSRSNSVRAVFCSGFVWSGSGAVNDYLREYPVAQPFGQREATFFGHQRFLLADGIQRNRNLLQRSILLFLCEAVYGISTASGRSRRVNIERRNALAADTSLEIKVDMIRYIADTIRELRNSDLISTVHVRDALRALNTRVLSLISGDNHFCLINNGIKAFDINVLSAVPDGIAVVVIRDPRDQIADQIMKRNKSGEEHAFAKNFVKSHIGNLRSMARQIKDLSLEKRVIIVGFEDFVLNSRIRRAVAREIGLNPDNHHENRSFFPELSATNIGIYRSFHDQKLMKWVYKEVQPYQPTPTFS